MKFSSGTVHVVDPDPMVRDSICELVCAMDLHCACYVTGREFLAAYNPSEPGCIVLEMRLPGMSGLQIQRRFKAAGMTPPLIFLSDQADISLAVSVLRNGAVHYLQKPLQPLKLIDAVMEALAVDASRREKIQQQQEMAESIALLTPKERELLPLIAEGLSNLEIASQREVSLRTVELRRTQLMQKLSISSSIGLLRFALLATTRDASSPHLSTRPTRLDASLCSVP